MVLAFFCISLFLSGLEIIYGFRKTNRKDQILLSGAQTLASRSGHQSLEPEHLLRVMLEDESGMVQKLLQAVGGDLARLKRELEGRLPNFRSWADRGGRFTFVR